MPAGDKVGIATHNNSNTQYKNESSTVKWAQWDKTQSRELLVCSYVCASHCAQLLHTRLHRTDLIVFPLTLQTITTARMMSIWGKGGVQNVRACSSNHKGHKHNSTYRPWTVTEKKSRPTQTSTHCCDRHRCLGCYLSQHQETETANQTNWWLLLHRNVVQT